MAESVPRILEALIFASAEPLSAAAAAQAIAGVHEAAPTVDDVEAAVRALNAAYQEEGRAFRIHEWAGGYRMATVEELAPFVHTLREQERERRLSRSQLETLAVVAYKQPVTKPEVDHVRGVQSDHALRRLLERGFIEVVGRADAVGRPLLYATTPDFLDRFGLSALDDLPKPREIEELLADPAFQHERGAVLDELDRSTPESEGGDGA
jgi:segregation and condensation protein B